MRSRRTSLALAICLLAVLAGTIAVIYGATRKDNPPSAPLPSASPQSPTSAAPSDRLSAPMPPSTSRPTVEEQPTGHVDMRASSIKIPALGVTGTIEPATVVGGVLRPPRRPTAVGLWTGSADLDSTRGEITLAGHVNWAGMPPFVFAKLAELAPGNLVYTTGWSGRLRTWRVTRVYARPKTQPVDQAAFAGQTGPSRLALITCGGAFDANDRSYVANVYVFASPLSPNDPESD